MRANWWQHQCHGIADDLTPVVARAEDCGVEPAVMGWFVYLEDMPVRVHFCTQCGVDLDALLRTPEAIQRCMDIADGLARLPQDADPCAALYAACDRENAIGYARLAIGNV